MKFSKCSLAALALASPLAFAADCTAPTAPTMPNGATSTMEEMVAGQQALKDFQATNNAYRECLDGQMETARGELKDDKEAAQEQYDAAQKAYNDSVAAEENLAGQFNAEVREYKAANPQ